MLQHWSGGQRGGGDQVDQKQHGGETEVDGKRISSSIEHNNFKKPNWPEAISWLFTSAARKLNQGLPRNKFNALQKIRRQGAHSAPAKNYFPTLAFKFLNGGFRTFSVIPLNVIPLNARIFNR